MNPTLRVLLATDAVGGVWVYSVELARALKPHGIEAVLAAMGPSPTAAQRQETADLELIDTQLPLDWMETSPSALRRAGDRLVNIAAELEVDVVQTCSAALLADATFQQPTVAVQHSCVASWWAAVRGTPLPPEFAWRRELVECGLNQATAVVAPTVAFAAETSRIYDVGAHVVAVHNGRRPLASPMLPQSDFVLTASRLWDEGKNVATLDAAAARLNLRIEAAGPTCGPNGAGIELKHLHALGQISATQLSGLLAARPVFVSAALYEPFGLSVLEAAQAGCALVLSDIPTHRELWDSAAVFVPARDDAQFAAAIQNLIDDPDRRTELGQCARVRAQLYTPERMASRMAEIYIRTAKPRRAEMLLQLAGAA